MHTWRFMDVCYTWLIPNNKVIRSNKFYASSCTVERSRSKTGVIQTNTHAPCWLVNMIMHCTIQLVWHSKAVKSAIAAYIHINYLVLWAISYIYRKIKNPMRHQINSYELIHGAHWTISIRKLLVHRGMSTVHEGNYAAPAEWKSCDAFYFSTHTLLILTHLIHIQYNYNSIHEYLHI